MRPLIGVTTSELRAATLQTASRESGPPCHEAFLSMAYFARIEEAGGMPVMLPPGDPSMAADLVARLDGLLLAGGPDIDPANYGAEPDPRLGETEPKADAFELAVARAAMAGGMAILGVCRGAQLINVARGGTLVQHVDGCRQTEPGNVATDVVTLTRRSRLHGVYRKARVPVNSFHHQAVDRLGEGLRVSGRNPDGLVKAIEAPGHPFLLGVQWHAETLADSVLFEALVAAAGPQELRVVA